jgi:hypothetical protein
MAEVEFNFSRKKDAEDPLYLDVVASPRRAAMSKVAPEDFEDPDRPLRLDLAMREPARPKRGVGMVIAGVAIVLVAGAAAVGAALLPSLLQRPPSPSIASAQAADADPALQAAPLPAAAASPGEKQAAPPAVGQARTSSAPIDLLIPPDRPRPAAARDRVRAHPAHATPKASEGAGRHRPPHAAQATRPPSRRAAAAERDPRAPKDLNLDALAKSLQ